jgi:hypothetical protein
MPGDSFLWRRFSAYSHPGSYQSDLCGGQCSNGPADLSMDASLVVGLFAKNTTPPKAARYVSG